MLRGFVDEDGSITIKGKMAAKLPIHPAWYNTFAEALSLGCSDEMVTIAATESTQQPMFLPPQPFRYTRDLAHRRFHCPVSDQMSLMNAFHSYIRTKNRFQTLMGKAAADKAVDEWCAHGFLSRDVLEEAIRLRKQLKEFFKSLFDQEVCLLAKAIFLTPRQMSMGSSSFMDTAVGMETTEH